MSTPTCNVELAAPHGMELLGKMPQCPHEDSTEQERAYFSVFCFMLFRPWRNQAQLLSECSQQFRAGFVASSSESTRKAIREVVFRDINAAFSEWEHGLHATLQSFTGQPHMLLSPDAYWAHQIVSRLDLSLSFGLAMSWNVSKKAA